MLCVLLQQILPYDFYWEIKAEKKCSPDILTTTGIPPNGLYTNESHTIFNNIYYGDLQ